MQFIKLLFVLFAVIMAVQGQTRTVRRADNYNRHFSGPGRNHANLGAKPITLLKF